MSKLLIQNISWPKERAEKVISKLIPLMKEVNKILKLKSPVIVHLYENKNSKDPDRAEYDEGVIILFEKTPDWRSDFLHELFHMILSKENMSITLKSKLNTILVKLRKNKGDGRVFIQPHTYSDIKEVAATYFKWYILGKVIDDAYIEVLENFQPGASKLVEKIIKTEKLIKSKKLILRKNNDILKSINQFERLLKNDSVKKKINYKGIPIDIEWPSGTTRQWPRCPYKNPMKRVHYGYIKNTNSEDGEEVDVYLRENPKKVAKVYRLSQLDKKTGDFDEHKFGLGFKSKNEFKKAYCNAMPKKMCGEIDSMAWDKFKKEILKFYELNKSLFFKAKPHKYIKKERKGSKWKYYYTWDQYRKEKGIEEKPKEKDPLENVPVKNLNKDIDFKANEKFLNEEIESVDIQYKIEESDIEKEVGHDNFIKMPGKGRAELQDKIRSGKRREYESFAQNLAPVHSLSVDKFLKVLSSGGLKALSELEEGGRQGVYAIVETEIRPKYGDRAANIIYEGWKNKDTIINMYDKLLDAGFKEEEAKKINTIAGKKFDEAREGAIGYGVDRSIGTNNHVFSILGPNGNGSGYGEISIILKQDIMKHPDFNMSPTAGTSFVSGEMHKHREWTKESMLLKDKKIEKEIEKEFKNKKVKYLKWDAEIKEINFNTGYFILEFELDSGKKTKVSLKSGQLLQYLPKEDISKNSDLLVKFDKISKGFDEQRSIDHFHKSKLNAKENTDYYKYMAKDIAAQGSIDDYLTRQSHGKWEGHLPSFVPTSQFAEIVMPKETYNRLVEIGKPTVEHRDKFYKEYTSKISGFGEGLYQNIINDYFQVRDNNDYHKNQIFKYNKELEKIENDKEMEDRFKKMAISENKLKIKAHEDIMKYWKEYEKIEKAAEDKFKKSIGNINLKIVDNHNEILPYMNKGFKEGKWRKK